MLFFGNFITFGDFITEASVFGCYTEATKSHRTTGKAKTRSIYNK